MSSNNAQRGPGRPPGSLGRFAKAAREAAAATGKLPHEILLDMARGEPISRKVFDEGTGTWVVRQEAVDMDMVLDAAKAGAPYFAPKIATVEVIQGVDNAALDAIIASAAAAAGVSVGSSGEGEETEGGDGAGEDAGDARPAYRLPRRATKA